MSKLIRILKQHSYAPSDNKLIHCCVVYNLILTGEAMEWGGRSISLVNLHGPAGEGTPGSRRRHTSGDTASACASTTTSLATAVAAPQTPEGEVDIFEHGSPISGVGEDPSILDEDSNDAKRDDRHTSVPEQMQVDHGESSCNSDPIYHWRVQRASCREVVIAIRFY